MIHDDFHWDNVLITFDDNVMIPLVHDFGNSRVVAIVEGAVERFPAIAELLEYQRLVERGGGGAAAPMESKYRTQDLLRLLNGEDGIKPFISTNPDALSSSIIQYINSLVSVLQAYNKAAYSKH